jgi:hypothetical protein
VEFRPRFPGSAAALVSNSSKRRRNWAEIIKNGLVKSLVPIENQIVSDQVSLLDHFFSFCFEFIVLSVLWILVLYFRPLNLLFLLLSFLCIVNLLVSVSMIYLLFL